MTESDCSHYNMQIKTINFSWISLFIEHESTRCYYKRQWTQKELFFIVITSDIFSYFVFLSSRQVIKHCITISLQLLLFENILLKIHEKHSCTHPALFSVNIQHKHQPNPILCHLFHYSSWCSAYRTMNKKITI